MAARLAQRAPVVVRPVVEDMPDEAIDEAPPVDADAPVGPGSDEESEYLGGETGVGELPLAAPAANEVEEEVPAGELPELEELNGRIPPEVLAVMDELFRAKFSKVQRVSAKHLKKT